MSAWITKLSDYDHDANRRHARKMLARLVPFGEWSKGESVQRAQMWLRMARHLLDIADLSPEEHKTESARLDIEAAVAFTEGSKS